MQHVLAASASKQVPDARCWCALVRWCDPIGQYAGITDGKSQTVKTQAGKSLVGARQHFINEVRFLFSVCSATGRVLLNYVCFQTTVLCGQLGL